jgi:hypothetical protein
MYFLDGFSTSFWCVRGSSHPIFPVVTQLIAGFRGWLRLRAPPVRRNPLVATILVHDCSQEPAHVGVALAVTQLVNIPASSALAYVADRTQRHTLVYRSCVLLPILVSVVLFVVVDRATDTESSSTSRGSDSGSSNAAAGLGPDGVLWAIGGLLVALSVVGGAAITPMLSGAAMMRLDAAGQSHMFGRLMIFRAMGWSSGSLLGGMVYQHGLPAPSAVFARGRGGGSPPAHHHVIPGSAAVVLCGLVGARSLQLLISMLVRLPEGGNAAGGHTEDAQQQRQQQQAPTTSPASADRRGREGLSAFLGNPHVMLFFLCMGINGIAGATYDNYVILFAKQDLGASGTILGLMTTATGVANTLMWWVQPSIIGVVGARLTLCVAMASTVLRCYLYTLATQPQQVVAIQLLHGVSWVCIWSGGTTFAHEMAPPHLKSTAQGVLSSVYAGAGAAAGLLLGGWIYGRLGARRMFELQAMGIGATGALYFVVEALPHAMMMSTRRGASRAAAAAKEEAAAAAAAEAMTHPPRGHQPRVINNSDAGAREPLLLQDGPIN